MAMNHSAVETLIGVHCGRLVTVISCPVLIVFSGVDSVSF